MYIEAFRETYSQRWAIKCSSNTSCLSYWRITSIHRSLSAKCIRFSIYCSVFDLIEMIFMGGQKFCHGYPTKWSRLPRNRYIYFMKINQNIRIEGISPYRKLKNTTYLSCDEIHRWAHKNVYEQSNLTSSKQFATLPGIFATKKRFSAEIAARRTSNDASYCFTFHHATE